MRVLNQQVYESETIPYRRCDILDRNGIVLASSEDVYNVILDCKWLTENTACIEPTTQALLQFFQDVTAIEIQQMLKEKAASQYCVLRKKLSYREINDFVLVLEEVYVDAKNKGKKVNPNIQGVWFEKVYQRKYPYNHLACKVLGFTSSDNIGIWRS